MRELNYTKIFIVVALILSSCSNNSNWPQFLGPGGNSVSTDVDLPAEWGNSKNILWKSKVPGKGWSSPIVWEEKVFITTAYKEKETTQKKDTAQSEPAADDRRIRPDDDYRFEIYCLNKNSGKLIWNKTAYLGKPGIVTHRDNTSASETAVTDGKNLYVYFGMRG